jgi:type III secretion system low calcium response chaperone LcrH/SycD
MYAYGFRLYNLGDYKKALQVFTGLTMIDPQDFRFHLSLGAAYHRLKNHVSAVDSYYRSAQIEPENPMPHYYMYDCFMQENLWGDAQLCLDEVIKRCGNHPECAELKARCKMLSDPLKAKIAEFEIKLEAARKQKAA